MHAVRMQCKALYIGNSLNPRFGPFLQVCGSITGVFRFFCIEDVAHLSCHPFSSIFSHFSPFSAGFAEPSFVIDGCWIMMMGNHRTSCTFTMQHIGSWVVTHS